MLPAVPYAKALRRLRFSMGVYQIGTDLVKGTSLPETLGLLRTWALLPNHAHVSFSVDDELHKRECQALLDELTHLGKNAATKARSYVETERRLLENR